MPYRRPTVTPSRALVAYLNAVSAVVLLEPSQTLSGNAGYRVLSHIFAHDYVLALILLAALVLQVAKFVQRRSPWGVTVAGAMLGFCVWAVVAVCILIAAPTSLGGYVYLGIAAVNGWTYVEARAERESRPLS